MLKSINISVDEAKYINRYVGRFAQYRHHSKVFSILKSCFGDNLPTTILVRRRTQDELVNYIIDKMNKVNKSINREDIDLRHKLHSIIQGRTTTTFEWYEQKYQIIMVW